MPDTMEIQQARRMLLERYLRGDFPQIAAGASQAAAIQRRASGSIAPLSFGQQQLWFLAQWVADIPVYTECVTIHLPGPLDIDALERSFQEVIRRHESWRTSFPVVDGQPVQKIHPPPDRIPLPPADLRHLPKERRVREALRLASGDARLPFDLANGPLLRTRLVRLNDEEHRLFLTLHHIIFDGFSLYQVFLPELHALYETFLAGKASPLPELPIQYADFAAWQRKRLQGNLLAEQLAYWRKQLAGAPAALNLPTDRPRPRFPTYRGSMQPFALSSGLTAALKALSHREGVTLYMTLVAAFQTVLSRYAGQDDIVIGTAIAERKRPEVQGLMGFFLNTLVLRTSLSGNPTFRELLGRVREVVLEAQAHPDVPFEYLVRALQPERNGGQNPFFQVLLTLEPPLTVLPSGWTLTQMDVETNTSKFDLSLELDDRPEGLIGRFEYNADLFDAATITRMASHWQTLLDAIVADPRQRLAELPLLTAAERRPLLVEWNATGATFREERCIHQIFEVQAERTPTTTAVICEKQHITYRELNRRANRLAHHLQRLGVGPEALVGICVKRSIDMAVGVLAVLKAGGAYVPLDPNYPAERNAFMLQDARAGVLLTQAHLRERLPGYPARIVYLDADFAPGAHEPEDNPESAVTPGNLAYVIYTSGSTGKPKGVAIEHRSAVALLDWAPTVYRPEHLAGVLASTSLCFDLSIFELFVPLCHGGTVILCENLLQLPALPAAGQVTLINTVPSVMAEILRGQRLPDGVRVVNLAGEPLPNALAQKIYEQETIQHVYNLYGPSEDTTYSTFARVEKGSNKPPPIGRPIANTRVYLLDRYRQPVPIGIPGELHLGGAGLARGYLYRPELTAGRFSDDPFSDDPGARLYKTGDLARYLPGGDIEFLGRIDYQVKIRGFRIEPGEIEVALRQHPGVRESVVVAREDPPGDRRLVAYVVPRLGQALSMSDLHAFLKNRLPEYMLPAAFVILEMLPLTLNGKVDRRTLPAPEMCQVEPGENGAPTLAIHRQLIAIWEDLLDVRPIGIKDNFFYLGGHSLLAARLVARIEQLFHKKITLGALFAGPSVEQLARTLLREEKVASAPASRTPVVPVRPGGSRRPFFYLDGDHTGEAVYTFNLARGFDPEQPFYSLKSYQFDGLLVPPTLEEIAAAHLKSIQSVQPEGPYLLGGFCNGGLVAYEMARQLHARGDAVDLLVLIDPAMLAPRRLVRSVLKCAGVLVRSGNRTQFEWFLRLRHLARYVVSREYRQEAKAAGRGAASGPKYCCDRSGETGPGLDSPFPKTGALRQDWRGFYYWAAANYAPAPYAGKIAFFWSNEDLYHKTGWYNLGRAAKEVEVHVLPGTRVSKLPEHPGVWTEALRACLDKAVDRLNE